MRTVREETIVSGDQSFNLVFMQLPAMRAHNLVVKHITPLIGAAIKGGNVESLPNLSALRSDPGGAAVWGASAIGGLLAQASSSSFDHLQKELFACVDVVVGGQRINIEKCADAVFIGAPDVIMQALVISFEHNFRPFFNALVGQFEKLMPKGAPPTNTLSISVGQPNG